MKRLFQSSPSEYLGIVHTLCRQSHSALEYEKFRLQERVQAGTMQSSPIKVNQARGSTSPELQSADLPLPLREGRGKGDLIGNAADLPQNCRSVSTPSPIKVNQARGSTPPELQLS